MRRPLTLLSLLAYLLGSFAAPVHASGMPGHATWLHDTETAMVGSQAYVRDRVALRRPGQRMAVVMDIDNTAMQTYYAYPRATPAVLRYARYARSKGVAVFFATGRSQAQLGTVPAKLRRAGYSYSGICVRRSGEPLATGKVRCRTAVQQRGYSVLAMVGNRSTDFEGGHWERSWRLPSYGDRLG